MVCPQCGATITSGKYCEYCGTKIATKTQSNQEQVNKKGCPKCGSSNISFTREKKGEVRYKRGAAVVHSTVGLCKDCGYTWTTDQDAATPKKRKTWLWVLGWIFIFPLPLTILMLRKKTMKPVLKYAIIAVAWILYLAIGASSKNDTSEVQNPTPIEQVVQTDGADEKVNPTDTLADEKSLSNGTDESTVSLSSFQLEIIANEPGEYGQELVLNAGTEFEDKTIGYFVPAGSYTVSNIGQYSTQVNIYKNEKNITDAGWEEWASGKAEVIAVNSSATMSIEEGYFFNVDYPAHITIQKID